MSEDQSIGPEMEHVSLPSKIRSSLAVNIFFNLTYMILIALASLVFWFIAIFLPLNLAILWGTYSTSKKKREPDMTFIDDIEELDRIKKRYWIDVVLLLLICIALVYSPSLDVIALSILFPIVFMTTQSMEDLGKVLVIRSSWNRK